MEIAPEAIIFESEATLNKKREGLKVLHSVVVQPRYSISVEITPRNFGDIMFRAAGAAAGASSSSSPPTSKNASKEKRLFKTKLPRSSRSSSGKTSLNSTSKKARIGKPGLSVSYSWSDRRTARKEEAENSKKKKKKGKRRRGRRRRRSSRKREKPLKSSTSEEEAADVNRKSRSRKWKNLMTPRRHRKHHTKKKTKKKKQPPLPLYATGGAAGNDDRNSYKEPFPRNNHPVQIQFIEECPASVDLCVIFNSNTAVPKFPGVIDMSEKEETGGGPRSLAPFRTTGGCRRVHRAADRSCFEFSNEISNQKKYYSHCFSVEFQVDNVRYVSHFQETDRVVVLWAKEIHGLYHGSGGGPDEHQTVTDVPVLLCLPHHQPQHNDNVKDGIEIMDLIICDAKSTAWSKNRKVRLFPVRQIKAADIQAYMNQTQRNGDGDSQSSCSDADSLTRKKKKQAAVERKRYATTTTKKKKKKKKRSRRGFGWLPRLRSLEKEVTQPPPPPIPTQVSDDDGPSAFTLAPPPELDLIALRRISKRVHPGLSSVEHSPRGPFVLTHSNYSVSSSGSASISSSSSSSQSISQPSSPSGDTTTTAVSHTSGSSWFTDSQAFSSYEEDEEEEVESSYIQLPKDSAGRIISDSIETASSISATSSAATTSTSSSWNQGRRRHRHHQQQRKKKKKKVKIPTLNLQATRMIAISPLASPRSPRPRSVSQRDRLLEGIAQKMKKEIQKTENPHKTSPRLLVHVAPLKKINVDQETTETSSADGYYNTLLSPRNDISPRLCAQHREEIMKQAQQKKDGLVVTRLHDAETINKMVEQQQRDNLVDLLNRKEAKKLEKSPRQKIKKLSKALSLRHLPTTKGRGGAGKMLIRQNSVRNKATFLPSTLYASHNCLPVRSDTVKTTTTTKELLKKQ